MSVSSFFFSKPLACCFWYESNRQKNTKHLFGKEEMQIWEMRIYLFDSSFREALDYFI